jgi:hypothetical protein
MSVYVIASLTIKDAVHSFSRFCLSQQSCRDLYPVALLRTIGAFGCLATDRPQRNRALRGPVHLHLPITVLARLNVALGLPDCLFREPPRNSDTWSLRRKPSICSKH